MAFKVLAIANQKGGVGKTTTALSLGAALSRIGKNVLVMDLDPHANASVHLSFFPESVDFTAYDLFFEENVDDAFWDKVIKYKQGAEFYFVPGNIRLSELEVDLKDRQNKGLILKGLLSRVLDRFDYVLIDCPPHVGVLLVNALVASDLVIIPIQTDFLAFYGIRLLFDTIRTLNRVLPSPVRFRALPTMFDRRAGACRRVLKLIRSRLKGRYFETVINQDTKFREACALGKVIFELDPETRGSIEYMNLAKEIVNHENA